MRMDDMIIVSVDDHIIEPPEMFDAHVPKSLKTKAPKMVTEDDGSQVWIFEDRKVANVGLNAVAGRRREEYGCEPTSLNQMRKGAYNVSARVDDMNANGIVASLNFGTFVSFDGSFFLDAKDKKTAHEIVKAYNDWHIDEWCGSYPGRFIPLAILPLWDIALVVDEIKRVVKKGCHAIAFSDNPSVKGLPSIHNAYWEPLWRVCQENGVVVNCHIGTGRVSPHASLDSPIDAWIASMPFSIAYSAADWLQLKALQRYPDLTIALSEGGIGWVPYFLERADFTFEHHHRWTRADFDGLKPSDVFRQHFLTCFIDDKFGVKNRHHIGVDRICYECDYPHSDSVWPKSPEYLADSFKGVPDDEVDKITHGNACKAYRFDPFSTLGREDCMVGALRAEAAHVDTTPASFGAKNTPAQGRRGVVTSRDVIELFKRNDGRST